MGRFRKFSRLKIRFFYDKKYYLKYYTHKILFQAEVQFLLHKFKSYIYYTRFFSLSNNNKYLKNKSFLKT